MMASYTHDFASSVPSKLTKHRSKAVVKPILKKIGSHSPSAKSSLDLDRGWEEQIHYSSHGWGTSGASAKGVAASGADIDVSEEWGDKAETGRAGRDVSFTLATTDLDSMGAGDGGKAGSAAGSIGGGSGAGNSRSKYSHGRSTSAASHASIASTVSGTGAYRTTGSFVHPFQQTPRTSTPPLAHAYNSSLNNLANLDSALQSLQGGLISPRDYSPTITEDEDLDLELSGTNPGYSNPHRHHRRNGSSATANSSYHSPSFSSQNHFTTTSAAIVSTTTGASTADPRRPSLASNRTSSLTDIHSPTQPQPPLRVNTGGSRSTSVPGGSRLAHVSSTSDFNLLAEANESPSSSSVAFSTATSPQLTGTASTIGSPSILSQASPPSTATAMSPIRTSLEGFRLRSRSDLDAGYHAERIRAERQKWQEKERQKELKREKEEVKRRERQGSKEAQRLEREKKDIYKEVEAQARQEAKEIAAISHRKHSSSLGDDEREVFHGSGKIKKTKHKCKGAHTDADATHAAAAALASANAAAHIPALVDAGNPKLGADYKDDPTARRTRHRHQKRVVQKQRQQNYQLERNQLYARSYASSNDVLSSQAAADAAVASASASAGASAEKLAFMGRNYETTDQGQAPRAQGVNFNNVPPRRNTAKRKTQGAWTTFVLWFRTRFLRLSAKLEK